MSKKLVQLKNCSKGFTLIESLMAMFILSMVLLGMASLLCSTMVYNQHSGNISTATTLAQDKLETLRHAGYGSIAGGTTAESGIDGNGNPGGVYTRSTTVDDTTLGNMKIITVSVDWDWKGASRNVTLKTILKG
jgi:prepilin-type N-terminal cleavage/methylation domain-containing protein